MVTVNLKVTKKDIELGCPQDGKNCPVARSFQRAVGKDIYADVDNSQVTFNADHANDGLLDFVAAVDLPRTVSKFIYAFDETDPVNYPVTPFSFSLRIKNSVAKLLKIRKRYLAAA